MAQIDASKAYRVAVVGDRDSVLGFMALGYHVEIAPDVSAAADAIERLAKSGEAAIIFVTEGYAEQLAELINRYKSEPLPAIVTIPSSDGSGKGYGMTMLSHSVERAVGADILS